MTDTREESVPTGNATPMWLFSVIAGAFALLYAYAVWNAVGTLITAARTFAASGTPLNALGWFVWLFAAVFPVIVYALAFRITRRMRVGRVLLLMLVGLCLVGVFWINVQAYTLANTASLIG